LQAAKVKGTLTFSSAYRGIDSALPGSMLATGMNEHLCARPIAHAVLVHRGIFYCV
jgi:hypothetical protein